MSAGRFNCKHLLLPRIDYPPHIGFLFQSLPFLFIMGCMLASAFSRSNGKNRFVQEEADEWKMVRTLEIRPLWNTVDPKYLTPFSPSVLL